MGLNLIFWVLNLVLCFVDLVLVGLVFISVFYFFI